MRTYQQTLAANVPVTLTVNGSFFALITAAGPVDLEFQYVGQSGATDISAGVEAGYSEVFPGLLTAVTVTSAIPQVIRYGCGFGVARFDRTTITSAQATTVTHAAATMTTGAVQQLAADTQRRRIIATAHPNNVGTICLGGGNTVTAANAARRLAAGESFIDEVAAAAALWALSDVAGDVLCIEVAQ